MCNGNCEEYNLDHAKNWFEHKPESMLENERVKLCWDFKIQLGSLLVDIICSFDRQDLRKRKRKICRRTIKIWDVKSRECDIARRYVIVKTNKNFGHSLWRGVLLVHNYLCVYVKHQLARLIWRGKVFVCVTIYRL